VQVLPVGEADQVRCLLAAGGADPVRTEPGHRRHACAVPDVRLEHGQVGEQAAGRVVEVVPPGREQPHVSPLPHRGRRPVAGFQDGERQAALGQVSGGGQPDRAGADDDDRQVVQAVAQDEVSKVSTVNKVVATTRRASAAMVELWTRSGMSAGLW
jgi:hypothetical protein